MNGIQERINNIKIALKKILDNTYVNDLSHYMSTKIQVQYITDNLTAIENYIVKQQTTTENTNKINNYLNMLEKQYSIVSDIDDMDELVDTQAFVNLFKETSTKTEI